MENTKPQERKPGVFPVYVTTTVLLLWTWQQFIIVGFPESTISQGLIKAACG